MCFINLFSLNKFASRFQIIVTISKFLVIGLIIVVGFYYLIFKGLFFRTSKFTLICSGNTGSFKEPFKGSTKDPGQIVGIVFLKNLIKIFRYLRFTHHSLHTTDGEYKSQFEKI